MDTSAIMGFTNSLFDVIKREQPDYLAVCFDKGGSVARTEAFPEYKANRQETPEAIRIAVPYIERILKAMNIPAIVKEGYEADDIIGTLAKKAEKKGLVTYMVTPDKDFAQLVSDNIFMFRPPRMGNSYEKWGVEEVKAKFEVETPSQVIDYLGMMGDSVDNIPGLPGVGDKTAKKFIAAYGSMEGLLANTHELKGKMKEKVEASKALGILSKELATIMLDVPVDLNEEALLFEQPNVEEVKAIFTELEFRRLTDSFLKTFAPSSVSAEQRTDTTTSATVSPPNGQFDLFAVPGAGTVSEDSSLQGLRTIGNTAHLYQHVSTALSRSLLIKKLMLQSSVCFDTETTGLKSLEVALIGIAFSWEAGKGYYVSFPEDQEETQQILEAFRPFLSMNP